MCIFVSVYLLKCANLLFPSLRDLFLSLHIDLTHVFAIVKYSCACLLCTCARFF